MDRFRASFARVADVPRRPTSISLDHQDLRLNNVGQVSKRAINRLDYHNPVSEWRGTPRRVHAKAGAPFGEPTPATSNAVFWKRKPKATLADTSPKRKSLIPSRDAAPPNPGRPEFGGAQREV